MLPDTTGRFGLVQIFDWDGFASHTPMTTSQIQSEAPYEDTVWGAFNPQAWNSAHPGMYVSRYMLPVEDNNSISGHDLAWWQANHPDWILYACNTSDGSPTKDLAWGTSYFPDVPLNFANPEVVQYQIQQLMIPYAKANGYNAIAADNTDLLNYLEGGNPEFGQTPTKSEYGCGTYDSSGTFHRVFGQGNDPAFIAAMVQWIQSASQMLHAAGLKLIINHPLYNAPTNSNEQQVLSAVDGMVIENGFTYYGRYQNPASTANLFSTALPWAHAAQQHHVAFLIVDYLCDGGKQDFNNGAPCPTDPMQIPAPQVDWALSTYALVNEGGADVYISPKTGEMPSYRPEYSTRYGAPCGAYTQSGNVYMRKFQGGLAIVNSGSTAVSVTLPHAATSYQDIEKRAISNPLNLGAADGYFLLTTNGCS